MLEQVGRYRILDRIGSGRLGELYRARDTRFGRTVALRIVSAAIAADSDRRRQLIDSARTAEALSHPNIAALYEVGEEAGLLFLAGEFVPGRTLSAEIAGIPINWRRALDIAAQVADALAESHAAGIVHGRLSTTTVVVTPKGTAKLLDSGLAAWEGPRADANERADILSLGRVLAEMLTGRPSNGTVPPLQPPAVDALIRKSFAVPDDSWPSPAVIAAELRAALL